MATTSAPLKRMKCTVCGYSYDPANGDARGGIEPGVAFTALSDDWACPICNASKIRFIEN
ncbi:MAG: rubredoxin [Methanospirillum sp.]|nr:rubredoxin [Methanospirillum sp.]